METGNKIGNEGVKALSEMLKVNTRLDNLYLHSERKDKSFHISATKAKHFHVFMQTDNQFGSEGAKALSDALKQHPIEKLFIGCKRVQFNASKEFS